MTTPRMALQDTGPPTHLAEQADLGELDELERQIKLWGRALGFAAVGVDPFISILRILSAVIVYVP